MMGEYKSLFTRCLADNGIKWNDRDESTIAICYKGDNLQQIEVVIEFNIEDWEVYNKSMEKLREVVEKNSFND